LNMLSTAAFTRLGKTYENLMVDMQAKNEKLELRSRRIVGEAAGLSRAEAEDPLLAADGSVKTALVMGKTGLTASVERTLLDGAHGNVRRALEAAESGE
jgi:N-acetylmuramic acid 6-phosphate etherase